jgi:hypothetical protein
LVRRKPDGKKYKAKDQEDHGRTFTRLFCHGVIIQNFVIVME